MLSLDYRITMILLSLIWLHFCADFLLQSDRVAIAKSSSNSILLLHVAIYSFPFLIFGWQYAVLNAVLHAVTDYFSSRATSRLYKAGQRHWFFAVIGLDQAIHLSCLMFTMPLMRFWP